MTRVSETDDSVHKDVQHVRCSNPADIVERMEIIANLCVRSYDDELIESREQQLMQIVAIS